MAAKKAASRPRKKTAGRRSQAAAARQPAGGSRKSRDAGAATCRAKVRMYRQGIGDCFLIRLPRAKGDRDYTILIDCGAVIGTPDAAAKMREIAEDILATTKEIDLLVATHEHWDHLSGFLQAAESFAKLKVHEVWLGWTENPDDDLAKRLAGERDRALAALRASAHRMQLAGDEGAAGELAGLLDFFGAAKGASTSDALEAVRKMGPISYRRPEQDPVTPDGVAARFYVLGPPYSEKAIRKTSPSKRAPETYGLLLDAFMNSVAPGLGLDAADSASGAAGSDSPFGTLHAIPTEVARGMAFFSEHYWGPMAAGWRRIDAAWMELAADFALQLDSKTNNTSLALAIELADGDVLLFAADAQVGNWLSWHDRSWNVDDRTVTGTELVERAILYKVGHHGSHNATLRDKGLEMMKKLQVAMLPVDHEVAVKKRWGNMPLGELVEALTKKTGAKILRSDADVAQTWPGLTTTQLYHEMDF